MKEGAILATWAFVKHRWHCGVSRISDCRSQRLCQRQSQQTNLRSVVKNIETNAVRKDSLDILLFTESDWETQVAFCKEFSIAYSAGLANDDLSKSSTNDDDTTRISRFFNLQIQPIYDSLINQNALHVVISIELRVVSRVFLYGEVNYLPIWSASTWACAWVVVAFWSIRNRWSI